MFQFVIDSSGQKIILTDSESFFHIKLSSESERRIASLLCTQHLSTLRMRITNQELVPNDRRSNVFPNRATSNKTVTACCHKVLVLV